VEHMDKAVGVLVEGLRQRGVLDNTLILFMSDNGGNAESGVPGRLEGEHPGDALSTVFVGQCWATLNNTPFVRYKHYTDEGGIATPLIVHWPNGISAARRSQLEPQPGHVIDIMPTCLDVGGAKYPQQFNGKNITPAEGVSLRPAFEGKPLGRPHPIFWEHEGNRAVLDGRWKLVALSGQPWRLYDTVADRTEQRDLATAEPDRLKHLAAEWDDYAARANVLPVGGWQAPERKKKGGLANFSKETRFILKMDDHLRRNQAPAIAGRGVTITAKFDAQKPTGVVVAQGGTAQGYTLYLEKGRLAFLVRIGGETTSITSPEPISGPHTAVARLQRTGAMSLVLDGKTIAEGKAPGAIPSMPVDGLDVGSDTAGLVGPYSQDNQFGGTIESVIVELE